MSKKKRVYNSEEAIKELLAFIDQSDDEDER